MFEQHLRTQTVAQPAIELATNHLAEECIVILAHDLRNYITSIHGHLSMLRQRGQADLDRQMTAGAILAVEQMDRLIDNIMDTVRMQRGFFELMLQPVDLALLARQCAELFQTAATPIMLDLPPTAIVLADEERLRQALHNLLANAIRHSPSGAPVTLSLTVEMRAESPWIVLAVCDQGAGIPPDMLPQIFEPFAADPRSIGLGLGLYLVHGITLAHGGTLTVRSTAGEGTCFELALPCELTITR
jgi:signal transduction histidine kinase